MSESMSNDNDHDGLAHMQVMVLSAVVPEEIMMKRQRQTFNANGSSVVHEDEAKRLANKN